MPDRRAGVAGLALLVLAAAGCSGDGSDAPATGPGTGESTGSTGSGASAPFELVATDQLSVSPDGGDVLADCWNGICRWDADGTLELLPDRGSVAVAPDWSTVATVDGGDVVLEDLPSGEQVARLEGLADEEVADGSPVTSVAYSRDGTLVAAAGSGDGGSSQLVVWTVDGDERASFDTAGEVHRIAFSPEGDRLATAGNGPVEVHDLATGASQEVPSGEGGTVAWHPDGDRLVGPGADGQPVVWDTRTWAVVAELRGTRLHEAAYAPDGATLALTSLDSTAVTVWDPDPAPGAPRARELTGHSDEPGAVAWSPDGSLLHSVSADDGVLAWEAGSKRARVDFELPEGR